MLRSVFISDRASFGEQRGRLATFVKRNPNKTIFAKKTGDGFEVYVRSSGIRELASKYTVERKDYRESKAAAFALLKKFSLVPAGEESISKSRRNKLVRQKIESDRTHLIVEPIPASIYGFGKDDRIVGYSGAATAEKRPVLSAKRMSDEGKAVIKSLPDNEASQREIKTFALLGVPKNGNIVQYYGTSYTSGELRVVMENCPNGTMEDLSDSLDAAVLDGRLSRLEADRMRLLLLRDIVSAAAQMSAENVTHRDFRSANCFISSDFVVKVGDFGTADQRVRLNEDLQSDDIQFKSPELIRGTMDIRRAERSRYQIKRKILRGEMKSDGSLYTSVDLKVIPSVSVKPSSDIWSLGVIGYKIFQGGSTPFKSTEFGNGAALVDEIQNFSGGKMEFPVEKLPVTTSEIGRAAAEKRAGLRNEVQDLIKSCLRTKPDHRPDARTLLGNPVWAFIGGDEGERELRSKMSRLFGKTEG